MRNSFNKKGKVQLAAGAQEEEQEMPRPPKDEGEAKSKTIKVKRGVHIELGKLGGAGSDYGDVVEMLLRFWKEHHK